MDFQLVAHGTRDVAIIVGADEIITVLEESQVTLGNIKGSRFSLPIKVSQCSTSVTIRSKMILLFYGWYARKACLKT